MLEQYFFEEIDASLSLLFLFADCFGGIPVNRLLISTDLYLFKQVFVLFSDLLVIQILALVAQQVHFLLCLVSLELLLLPHVLDPFLKHLILNGLLHSSKLCIF